MPLLDGRDMVGLVLDPDTTRRDHRGQHDEMISIGSSTFSGGENGV
jgi:hypothetical protein